MEAALASRGGAAAQTGSAQADRRAIVPSRVLSATCASTAIRGGIFLLAYGGPHILVLDLIFFPVLNLGKILGL